MLRTLRGFNDSNFPAFSGRILSMLRKEVSQLRMDTRPPYPCRSLRWVQRPPARVVTRDGEIIRLSSIIAVLKPFSSRYALKCVTLCIGELTRVCAYPPKCVLKSQDPLFHGDNHRSSGEQKPRPKSGAPRSIF